MPVTYGATLSDKAETTFEITLSFPALSMDVTA